MNISFTLADTNDAPLLLEFMREYYAYDGLDFDEDGARTALRQLLSDASLGRVWLIRADSEPIGYLALTFGFALEYHGRDAFIDEFYIRETFRHKGIGTRTLRFVAESAQNLNIRALHLVVERHNSAAENLYRKAGFDLHDRTLMTRLLPESGV